MISLYRPWRLRIPVLVSILSLSLVVAGCGGKDEPSPGAPAGENTVAYVEPDSPPTAPAGVSMGEVVPETLAVLQFMPPAAQVAIALPPLPTIIEDALELGSVAEPREAVEAELAKIFQDIGADVGVVATDYGTLAAGLGLEPDTPIAFFADFTEMARAAGANAAQGEAGAAAPPIALEGNALESGSDRAKAYLEAAGTPYWVAVARVTDRTKATDAFKRYLEKQQAGSTASPGAEDAGGIMLSTFGKHGYFSHGPFLAMGTLDLLRGAAARATDPARLRYATVECPATEPDEIAMLIHGGRFLPIMEDVLPLIGMEGDGAMLAATAQMAMYEKMFSPDDTDPIVATLARSEGRLEMLWRVDTATHPGIMEVTGPAQPLRLARHLPAETLGMVSFRFNEQYKQQLMNNIMPAVGASGDEDLAVQMTMASQFITQLGDEATIAVAGTEGGLPEVFVLLGLSQPESTRGVLQMFVPMEAMDGGAGTSINKISTPWLPVFLSFQDDYAVASTSESGIRTLLDRMSAGEVTGLFSSMNPPYDIDRPRYQATVIQSRIVDSIANAIGMFSPDAPDTGEFAPYTTAIRELRSGKELDGSWLTGRITLYLGDLAAAARMLEEHRGEAAPVEAAEPAASPDAL